jgi:hypothetical protein
MRMTYPLMAAGKVQKGESEEDQGAGHVGKRASFAL